MNIKEFLLEHPGEALFVFTPRGHAWLPPRNAKELLEGRAIMLHRGPSAVGDYISADDLLSQSVQRANFKDGSWAVHTEPQLEALMKTPDPVDILERLNQKLDQNYKDFVNECIAMEQNMLIEYAREIAATKQVYDELKGNEYSRDYLEYLVRFENPLEVVRDKWIEEFFEPDISAEMGHALWSITDKQDAEHDYALDSEYTQQQDGGMKLC